MTEDRWDYHPQHAKARIRRWEWVVVVAIIVVLGLFGALLYDFLAEVVAG